MQEMTMPEAGPGNLEALLHGQSPENRYMMFDRDSENGFAGRIDHRAIGVVYNPEGEKWGNYVPSLLSRRYDAFIYIDTTRALHPLHLPVHAGKMPETFPFGY